MVGEQSEGKTGESEAHDGKKKWALQKTRAIAAFFLSAFTKNAAIADL